MRNNTAVSILPAIELKNKIITEYVINWKEFEKNISFPSKVLILRIAGPKDKLFQMLTPTISKSTTDSQNINN